MARKVGRDPGRSVRVDDELWNAALDACAWRRDGNLSFVMRKALAAYVRATDRMKKEVEEGTRTPPPGLQIVRRTEERQ